MHYQIIDLTEEQEISALQMARHRFYSDSLPVQQSRLHAVPPHRPESDSPSLAYEVNSLVQLFGI